jgi:4-hydroxysphinganine ceramide fatty acyl 2-hydroxylase
VLGEKIVSDDWEATEDFHPDDTDVMADFARSEFLDLNEALLPQIWYGNFSKEFYLEQVHQPRHVTYSAKMFPWPALEVSSAPFLSLSRPFLFPSSQQLCLLTMSMSISQMLTKTEWYVVPCFWLPITFTLFALSSLQFSSATSSLTFRGLASLLTSGHLPPAPTATAISLTAACWALGCFIWTLLEYGFHRFLFHLDDLLPEKNWALLLHFTMHGIHHYLPMVRPLLSFTRGEAKSLVLTLVSLESARYRTVFDLSCPLSFSSSFKPL